MPLASTAPPGSTVSAPAGPATAVVDTPGTRTPLRMRSIPGTDGKILGELKRGTTVTLLCRVNGEQVNGTRGTTRWWHRVTHGGETGYVSAAFLQGGDATVTDCPEETPAEEPSSGTPAAGEDPRQERRIVAIAKSQLGKRDGRNDCNPYGGCMPWDALLATWVWRRAGITLPVYHRSGDIYTWGRRTERAHRGAAGVGPGDLVLLGSGPGSAKTRRVDIVIGVFPDHVRVIGGNVNGKVTARNVPLTSIYAWIEA